MACPFKVGDHVIFVNAEKVDFPGERGCPALGETVRVSAIIKHEYLQWEGMGDYPGGGLHWSCFAVDKVP